MNRKRGIVLTFLIAAIITIFTNYFAMRVIVILPEETYNHHNDNDDDDISTSSTTTTIKSKINLLLNYRVNKTNSYNSLSNEIIIASAMDNEMILNHPLNLPENWINCTTTTTTSTNNNIQQQQRISTFDTTNSNHEYKNGKSRIFKRSSFTIITNIIVSDHQVNCDEYYITYTTHGDFRYLDNLVPLVERWIGPISITLYTPSIDLYPTLERIYYLRECTTPLIKEWVTFHLFSDTRYFIDPSTFIIEMEKKNLNILDICKNIPEFGEGVPTIRTKKNLLYPVNVARNVARQEATTYYILASDIELYPSLNLISDFFELIIKNETYFQTHPNPYVFVLPIFEIEMDVNIPEIKEQLIDFIKKNLAIPFHKYICPECHIIPKYNEWLAHSIDDELNVFHVAKRKQPFHVWEPIYIGTNNDPYYDERLSWEGLRDKMSQGYALCVLNYDFMILDNGFLIHRPGINKKKHNSKKPNKAIRKQNRIIIRKVQKELNKLYGIRPGCVL